MERTAMGFDSTDEATLIDLRAQICAQIEQLPIVFLRPLQPFLAAVLQAALPWKPEQDGPQ